MQESWDGSGPYIHDGMQSCQKRLGIQPPPFVESVSLRAQLSGSQIVTGVDGCVEESIPVVTGLGGGLFQF
jgi:hypothetical protein